MDTKELRKIAEYLNQVAASDVPSLLDAADIISNLKKIAGKAQEAEAMQRAAAEELAAFQHQLNKARTLGRLGTLGGLAAGAAGAYYLTKRHYRKQIGQLEKTLPDYTTPRELSVMKNTAEQAYMAGYNKALEDISKQMKSASRTTSKRGEMAPSEKFRKILLKTAEDLVAAADRLEELEAENRRLSNQNKLMKAAEAMVEQGMASDTEQALRMLDDALQSGSDPGAILNLLKSKGKDIDTF